MIRSSQDVPKKEREMKILNVKPFKKKAFFKKSALVAMLSIAISQSLAAAGLTASLSSDTVGLGEAFELTIATAESNVQSLDLAALKQHFNLIGSSQSMRTQIINGQRSAEKSWRLTLTAKDLGEFTLPAISAGQYSSNPLALKVVAAAQQPKAIGVTGVSMKVEVSDTANKQFYPFQEIPIKVRIETNQALQQAELIVPKNADLELSQLGEDNVTQTVKNGQRLQVIEREYVLKPQVSGSLTLPPFVLRGKVANQKGHTRSDAYIPHHLAMMREFSKGFGFGSGFSSDLGSMLDDEFGFMGSSTKPFQVRTEPLKLEVAQALSSNTASAQQKSWFLPAKKLEITGQWQENPEQMKVGQAIVRKITLTALGVTPEQLPMLDFKASDAVKIYIDSTKTDQVKTAQGTVARRETLISIVPTKTGEIELPAVEVPWMNTQTNQSEVALLPALKVNVEVANSHARRETEKGQPAAGLAATAKGSGYVKESPQAPLSLYGRLVAAYNKITTSLSFLQGLMLGSILLILVFLLSYLKRQSTRRNENLAQPKELTIASSNKKILTKKTEQERLSALQQALKSNDVREIYSGLMAWSRIKNDPLLARKLAPHIQQLERAIYNHTVNAKQQSCDLKLLKKQITALLNEQNKKCVQNLKQLPSLYPSD